ncbi:hypothetical protein C9I98_19125 [Photobacterium sanctipauli]|uniref:Uncharacterized protein n=1 Tax=Photobacterium sanctipauli TaxID=1342794 RepID=A0A2T3NNS3_9GAMM|nr:hypothetical protein [Photobacterium sanctipauli]PSW17631.1 hypothetical protein C9I98_19125 [Photobacterium sanctipauli]
MDDKSQQGHSVYLEEHYYSISIVTKFIQDIGVVIIEKTHCEPVTGSQCWIYKGRLYFYNQSQKEIRAGELLFMAGIIATTPAADRFKLHCRIVDEEYQNMMVLAWCWAAIHNLGLNIDTLLYSFSDESYYQSFERWTECRFLGVPLLQNAGMTLEPTRQNTGDAAVFPNMRCWLRR